MGWFNRFRLSLVDMEDIESPHGSDIFRLSARLDRRERASSHDCAPSIEPDPTRR